MKIKILHRILLPSSRLLLTPKLSRRNIFTRESLGIDSFDKWCEERRVSCGTNRDDFYRRFDPGAESGFMVSNGTFLLTDDLKNAIAFCNDSNSDNVDKLLCNLEKACYFHQEQMKVWHFSTFPFGSVMLKLCYKLNAVDHAVKMLRNQDAADIFDHLSSYQLCMDLLLKNGRFSDLLDLWSYFLDASTVTNTVPYPRSLLILVYAALYELNTRASLESGFDLYKKVRQSNANLSRRALSFLVALCIKQNESEIAYELLSTVNSEEFVLGRSLKIILCHRLGRFSEIAYLLQKIILSDVSTDFYEDNRLSNDVIGILQTLAEQSDNEKLKSRLVEHLKLLRQGGHFLRATVDQLLTSPISLASTSNKHNTSFMESIPIQALPAADFDPDKLKLLAYSNETKDLDDLTSFTQAEKRQKRRDRIAKALVEKVAKDGPFES